MKRDGERMALGEVEENGERRAMGNKCNTIFSITVQADDIEKCTGYNLISQHNVRFMYVFTG